MKEYDEWNKVKKKISKNKRKLGIKSRDLFGNNYINSNLHA